MVAQHSEQGGAPRGRWRTGFVVLVIVLLFSLAANVAQANLFGVGKDDGPAFVQPAATAAPSPSSTRPPYQFPPVSSKPLPATQQCPDAGSVGAGSSDTKTEILVIKGNSNKPVRLLGPNRRVVVAPGAVMTGSVTICGDGATVLIIGTLKGTVLLQGSGVKIVVQDGDAKKLPSAYSTTNGRVFRCTTGKLPEAPNCADYQPRPGAKPNG